MATVSVSAGGTVVTGTDTHFEGYDGDLFVLSSEAIPILRVDSPSQLVLKYAWPNTTVTDSQDFAILKTGPFWRDTINVLSAVNTLLDKVNQGLPFSIGAAGSFTGRDSYNAQPAGFVYLASDPAPARVYVKTGTGSSAWTRGIVVEGTGTISGPGGGVSQPAGTIYFVSTTLGNDGNSGVTTGAPWKTIDRVNAQTLKPGDQVAFRGGETFPGNLLVSNVGDASGRISYCAYGTGRPTISAGQGKAVYGLNTPYVDVRDIIVLGGAGNATHGIHFECNLPGNAKLAGPHIENCKATEFGWNGIFVQGTNGASGFDDIQIRYGYIEHCTHNMASPSGSCGIYIKAGTAYGTGVRAHTNAVVELCTVKDCPGTAGSTNWSGSGIVMSQVNGGAIRLNDVSLCGGAGDYIGGGPVGAWTNDSTAVVIEKNISHENKGSASHNQDGGGFDLDGGSVNCIVRYNISYGNDGAGVLVYAYGDNLPPHQGCLIHHNLLINDGLTSPQGSIHVRNDDGNPMSIDIFNNTVLHTRTHGALWVERANGAITWRAANNILRSTHNDGYSLVASNSEAGGTLYANCYFADGITAYWNNLSWNTLASFLASATAKERISGSIVANAFDPKFVGGVLGSTDPNDYILGDGSPLGDAGVNISTLFGISLSPDKFGIAIPQGPAPSIGFSEIASGSDAAEAEIAATYTFSGPLASGYGNPQTDPTILRNGTYTAASTYKTDSEGSRSAPIWIIADCQADRTLTGINLGCESFAEHLNGCFVHVSNDTFTWHNCGQVWQAVPGQTHYFKLGRRVGMRYIRLWKGFDYVPLANESRRIAISEFRPLGY